MSIEAIRATTAQVREQVVAAHHDLRVAGDRLSDAIGTLADLSRSHSASLVAPEHHRADEQLAACLEQLAGCLACLDRFVAGL
ncbi:MAG TPA: hypothetical protein VHV74_21160 [Pseudonocardiaceae bacterium]|jgi:hypothetical protein|nr:hypothetical protein [Pseudonocardiaceae bacterium]